MNHALESLRVQQTDVVRAHFGRMHQPAVSQNDLPSLQGSPTLHFFENANDGRRGPGHPADHVRSQATMQEEREIVDDRYISPYPTRLNRLLPQENYAGTMAMHPQMSPLNFDFQRQADQVAVSAFLQPLIQQQSFAQIEGMVSGSSIYGQSMHVLSRQENTPSGVMMEGGPALDGMYGAPDIRSYARDMGSANFNPELLRDQMESVPSAPSSLFACPHARCKYQHHKEGAYRYVRYMCAARS